MSQGIYETDQLLAQYLDLHYGPAHFGVPNYPAACAHHCLRLLGAETKVDRHPAAPDASLATPCRILELGCATGRTAFEFARAGAEVTAVDLSERFIEAACALRRGEALKYWLVDEGEIGHWETCELSSNGLLATAMRVKFIHADAVAWISDPQGEDDQAAQSKYQLIFAGNLIDRLDDPAALLRQLPGLLAPEGFIVLASPYTLLETFTPRANWVGGFYTPDQHPLRVREGLKQLLAPALRPALPALDQPFVIRETQRKFQHTVAELTFWKRPPCQHEQDPR